MSLEVCPMSLALVALWKPAEARREQNDLLKMRLPYSTPVMALAAAAD